MANIEASAFGSLLLAATTRTVWNLTFQIVRVLREFLQESEAPGFGCMVLGEILLKLERF
jgi:hypothetical protein